MKRINDCTHPTCCGGDCRKCPYNPKAGYSPYHYKPAMPDTPNNRENVAMATWYASNGYGGCVGFSGLLLFNTLKSIMPVARPRASRPVAVELLPVARPRRPAPSPGPVARPRRPAPSPGPVARPRRPAPSPGPVARPRGCRPWLSGCSPWPSSGSPWLSSRRPRGCRLLPVAVASGSPPRGCRVAPRRPEFCLTSFFCIVCLHCYGKQF